MKKWLHDLADKQCRKHCKSALYARYKFWTGFHLECYFFWFRVFDLTSE